MVTKECKPIKDIHHLSLIVIGYLQLLLAVIAGCFNHAVSTSRNWRETLNPMMRQGRKYKDEI